MISLLVSLHVIAVFVEPLGHAALRSELARTIAGGYGPYLQAAFLNNGYHVSLDPSPVTGHDWLRYEIVYPRWAKQIDPARFRIKQARNGRDYLSSLFHADSSV